MQNRLEETQIEDVTPKTEKTFFPTLEGEYVEEDENNLMDYTRVSMGELFCDGTPQYTGKPKLSEIRSFDSDYDGEPKIEYRIYLEIVNHEDEEYLSIPIKLKVNGDLQRGVHFKSKLYALVGGLKDLETPGWSKKNNRIRKVDLSEQRIFINDLNIMSVEIIENPPFKNGQDPWYSFKIIDVKL